MSILHVNQIAKRICESFSDHIPKEDLNPADPELTTKVQTRCLAAYAVKALTGCSEFDAGTSVTDGGDDNGLDAIFYSAANNCLVLVQSKWIKDGSSEPDSAEITKFCNGVKNLVNSDFDRFNDRIRSRQTSIENALGNFDCRLLLVLAHTGKSTLATHATRHIQDLLGTLNDASEIATFENLGQDRIYSMLAEGAAGGANDLEFGLSHWGKVDAPHDAFYGMVTGTEVAAWWHEYGERLFTKNLRSVLGNTDVNKMIGATIDTRPEDFWYFNNGITVTAKRVEKTLAGGASRDIGAFKAFGASVVNGAQTVSSLGRHRGAPENLETIRVPLRVISLEDADDQYGMLITQTNNTQNRIEARDFASQDPEQHRIRVELQMEGIEYNIARSDGFKRSENAFDLEEATIALACAQGESMLAVQLKTKISQFWIDLEKSPYKRLFNPSISSLYILQSVIFHRMVEKRIGELIKQLERRSGKKYGVLVHGNRLIASVAFRRQRLPQKLGDPRLTLDLHVESINKLVDQAVDTLEEMVGLKYSDNFLAVVFKNPTKSNELFDMCVEGVKRKQVQLDLDI